MRLTARSPNPTLCQVLANFCNSTFYKCCHIYGLIQIFDMSEMRPEENGIETTEDRNAGTMRLDYISWDEYFMATAFLAAKRSKDPVTQVGACIVNEDKKIVGVGYNGMPIGCDDQLFPWGKNSDNVLETKHLYVCHAEMNAILNKNSADVKNCTMYVALFPCNECAKFIIQSGIREVIYMSDKHAHKLTTVASKRMFEASGVKCRQFRPQNKTLTINFTEINWNDMNQLPTTPMKKLNLDD